MKKTENEDDWEILKIYNNGIGGGYTQESISTLREQLIFLEKQIIEKERLAAEKEFNDKVANLAEML